MQGRENSYCELGKELDALARSRNVRGPYSMARYLNATNGYECSGQVISRYLYGKSVPKRAFLEAFADAFDITEQERMALAWVYTYGSPHRRGT